MKLLPNGAIQTPYMMDALALQRFAMAARDKAILEMWNRGFISFASLEALVGSPEQRDPLGTRSWPF